MTAEDWEAWCDATAVLDDEPPPGPGWDDEDPELAPGEQVCWTAGFGKGGDADGLPGGSELAFLADAAAGDDDRYLGATDAELDGRSPPGTGSRPMPPRASTSRSQSSSGAVRRRAVSRRTPRTCRPDGMSSPSMSCACSWPSPNPPWSG